MVSITISTATKSYQGTDARCDKKEISPLFEIANVLVRLDHVASFIVNPITARYEAASYTSFRRWNNAD
jgi:hypothetical protein